MDESVVVQCNSNGQMREYCINMFNKWKHSLLYPSCHLVSYLVILGSFLMNLTPAGSFQRTHKAGHAIETIVVINFKRSWKDNGTRYTAVYQQQNRSETTLWWSHSCGWLISVHSVTQNMVNFVVRPACWWARDRCLKTRKERKCMEWRTLHEKTVALNEALPRIGTKEPCRGWNQDSVVRGIQFPFEPTYKEQNFRLTCMYRHWEVAPDYQIWYWMTSTKNWRTDMSQITREMSKKRLQRIPTWLSNSKNTLS